MGGLHFFDFQVFREKIRFCIDFGRVLGRIWEGFWTSKARKKAFKRGSKSKPKKIKSERQTRRKIPRNGRGRRHGGGLRERRIRTRTWTIKFNTPLHPSVGSGRRILKREALCRQLPSRFWRLEAAWVGSRGFVGRLEAQNLKPGGDKER